MFNVELLVFERTDEINNADRKKLNVPLRKIYSRLLHFWSEDFSQCTRTQFWIIHIDRNDMRIGLFWIVSLVVVVIFVITFGKILCVCATTFIIAPYYYWLRFLLLQNVHCKCRAPSKCQVNNTLFIVIVHNSSIIYGYTKDYFGCVLIIMTCRLAFNEINVETRKENVLFCT